MTGGKAYTKTCETLGIIPAKYFLRTVQAKEVNICMAHHGIGPKGAKAISVALVVSILTNEIVHHQIIVFGQYEHLQLIVEYYNMQANTSVTHLDLSDNGLGTEGAIAISTMMKENCYISHLVCSPSPPPPSPPPPTLSLTNLLFLLFSGSL